MPDPTCTGLDTIPTADGPDHRACTCTCTTCTARTQVQKRYVEPGFTAAMLDQIPDEEAW